MRDIEYKAIHSVIHMCSKAMCAMPMACCCTAKFITYSG